MMPRNNTSSSLDTVIESLAPAALEALPFGIIIFSDDFSLVWKNRSARELLGENPNLLGLLGQCGLSEPMRDVRRTLQEGGAKSLGIVRHVSTANRERLLELTCVAMRPPSNELAGLLLLEDVSGRASIETRLAISEKLAALGTLAAKIAHEVNNPLDGSYRFVNLALRVAREQKLEQIERYLTESAVAHRRMMTVLSELLEYSRTSQAHFDLNDINTLLGEALKLMSDRITERKVVIISDLGEPMPRVRGDALFQVFCNVIRNSIDAMPDGGTLSVQTTVRDSAVHIHIQDTGVGLPLEADRIFEPFYTTKPPGEGTGLGLALSKEIVTERYGGQIRGRPARPRGAAFEIEIPLQNCVATAARQGRGDDRTIVRVSDQEST